MSFCILGDIVGDSEEKVGSLPASAECSLGRRPTWRPARARRVLRVSPSLRVPCPSSSSSSGKTGVSLTMDGFMVGSFLPFFILPFCVVTACSVGWFVSLLVREEVLLTGLCERKILFRLKIYDHLRQATAKRTGCEKVGLVWSVTRLGCIGSESPGQSLRQ